MEDKLNDNVVIPDEIKQMTREELEAAIRAMEAELKLRSKEAS